MCRAEVVRLETEQAGLRICSGLAWCSGDHPPRPATAERKPETGSEPQLIYLDVTLDH
jgi:hypothetical protein